MKKVIWVKPVARTFWVIVYKLQKLRGKAFKVERVILEILIFTKIWIVKLTQKLLERKHLTKVHLELKLKNLQMFVKLIGLKVWYIEELWKKKLKGEVWSLQEKLKILMMKATIQILHASIQMVILLKNRTNMQTLKIQIQNFNKLKTIMQTLL